MKSIKLFLVDDHKLIRDGIRAHFEEDQNYEIVGEASNGKEALQKLETLKVDVVLMDINMDVMDGIECTSQLSKLHPEVKVLALTMLAENQHIKEMLKAGALGYMLKNALEQEIKNGICAVYEGKPFYSPEVTQTVMNNLTVSGKKKKSRFEPQIPLTSREKEVLLLIIKEYSNQEIADALFISKRTVDAHKRNLLEKTGSKNVAGLVMYALNNQIYSDQEL